MSFPKVSIYVLVLVGVVFHFGNCAPAIAAETTNGLSNSKPEKECNKESAAEEDKEEVAFIDQSQNGTENWRISIKDIVFIWTQPETLFAAAALLDPQLLGGELPGSEEPAIADNSTNELQQQSESTEDKPSPSSSTNNASLQTASETSSEAATQKSKLRNKFRQSGLVSEYLKRKLVTS